MRPAIPLLLGLAGLAAAVEGDGSFEIDEAEGIDQGRAAVFVDRMRLMPGGNLRNNDGLVRFHPMALLEAGIDSNPEAVVTNPLASGFLRYLVGLEARMWDQDRSWRLLGTAHAEQRRYIEDTAASPYGADLGLGLTYAGDRWSGGSRFAWRQEDQPTASITDVVLRQIWMANAYVGHEWARSAVGGTLRWDRLDYREDAPDFGRNERDYERITGLAEAALLGGEDTRLGIELGAGATWRPAEALITNNQEWSGQVRWRTTTGVRITHDLRLGAVLRCYQAASSGSLDNDDDRVLAPSASWSLQWLWHYRSRLDLGLSSGLAEGIDKRANCAQRQLAELALRWNLHDRVDLVIGGMAMYRRDSGATAMPDPARRADWRVDLGPEVRLAPGTALRLQGTYMAWSYLDDSVGWVDRALLTVGLGMAL